MVSGWGEVLISNEKKYLLSSMAICETSIKTPLEPATWETRNKEFCLQVIVLSNRLWFGMDSEFLFWLQRLGAVVVFELTVKANRNDDKRIKDTIYGRVWIGGLKTRQSDSDGDCLGKVVEKEALLTCWLRLWSACWLGRPCWTYFWKESKHCFTTIGNSPFMRLL